MYVQRGQRLLVLPFYSEECLGTFFGSQLEWHIGETSEFPVYVSETTQRPFLHPRRGWDQTRYIITDNLHPQLFGCFILLFQDKKNKFSSTSNSVDLNTKIFYGSRRQQGRFNTLDEILERNLHNFWVKSNLWIVFCRKNPVFSSCERRGVKKRSTIVCLPGIFRQQPLLTRSQLTNCGRCSS